MISVFEYQDYRAFIKDSFSQLPKKGYGQAHKLALFLEVHTTLVSQVLSELKDFTTEQAALVCEFLNLNEMESEYFVLLVQLQRAGNQALRKIIKRQLQDKKKISHELVNRLKSTQQITEEQRAIFYSDWSYSAVRQATAIEGLQKIEAIAEHLKLPVKRVKQVVAFLIKTGLCVEKSGELRIGPSSTHLESSSPWVKVHHTNWRDQAVQKMTSNEESQLHYTAPMTLSKEDALRLREKIVQFLEEVDKVIDPSPSEDIHCLNIDWFKV